MNTVLLSSRSSMTFSLWPNPECTLIHIGSPQRPAQESLSVSVVCCCLIWITEMQCKEPLVLKTECAGRISLEKGTQSLPTTEEKNTSGPKKQSHTRLRSKQRLWQKEENPEESEGCEEKQAGGWLRWGVWGDRAWFSSLKNLGTCWHVGRSMACDVSDAGGAQAKPPARTHNFSGCSSLLHIEFKFRCQYAFCKPPLGQDWIFIICIFMHLWGIWQWEINLFVVSFYSRPG